MQKIGGRGYWAFIKANVQIEAEICCNSREEATAFNKWWQWKSERTTEAGWVKIHDTDWIPDDQETTIDPINTNPNIIDNYHGGPTIARSDLGCCDTSQQRFLVWVFDAPGVGKADESKLNRNYGMGFPLVDKAGNIIGKASYISYLQMPYNSLIKFRTCVGPTPAHCVFWHLVLDATRTGVSITAPPLP